MATSRACESGDGVYDGVYLSEAHLHLTCERCAQRGTSHGVQYSGADFALDEGVEALQLALRTACIRVIAQRKHASDQGRKRAPLACTGLNEAILPHGDAACADTYAREA